MVDKRAQGYKYTLGFDLILFDSSFFYARLRLFFHSHLFSFRRHGSDQTKSNQIRLNPCYMYVYVRVYVRVCVL